MKHRSWTVLSSTSIAVCQSSKRSKATPLALLWALLRDEWPFTMPTLPTREHCMRVCTCVHVCAISFRAKDNFTFKCHRSVVTGAGQTQDIYAVCLPYTPCSSSPSLSLTGELHCLPSCAWYSSYCGGRWKIQFLGQRCSYQAEDLRCYGPAHLLLCLQLQWQPLCLLSQLRLVQGTCM